MKTLRDHPSATCVASGYTIAGRTSCWLMTDRVLVVEQQLVLEEYRRFELRNLQALILCETRLGTVASVILLLSILVFAGGAILAATLGGPLSVTVICAGSAVLLAISLIIHRWRGPTACLELHTAVQRFVVPGVHRWRAGKSMMDAVATAARSVQTSEQGAPDATAPPRTP